MNSLGPDGNDLNNGIPDGADGLTHENGPPGEDDRWLRSVVENSSEIIKVLDLDGTLRYASPSFGRILGYDPDEAVGTNVLDYVHPDDLPHVLEETEKALSETGVARNKAEYRFRHKDGSWRWIEAVGTYLTDDPAVGGVVVNARDVTERKEAEKALEESERRYATLLSNEPALVYRCLNEPDWPLVFVSDYALELTGHQPEDLLIGGDVRYGDLIVEEDRLRVWEGVQEALAGHRRFRLRYAIGRKDGALRHVEEYGQGIYGEDGEIQAIDGLVYDVTEVMRAEERLRETEERYRTLIERIPAITYIQEPDQPSRTTYISPQHERILGYTPEEAMRSEQWVNVLHPDDREKVLAEDQRTNETGEPFRMEYRQFARDGRVVWLRDEATLVRDRSGLALYWLGVQLDITERKEAEEALKEGEERYRNQSRELALLHQVRSALAQELDPPSVFSEVVEAIAETYGYTQVSAYLLEGEELVLQHQVGYHQVIERIPLSQGVSGRTVSTGQPVLIEDVRADQDFLGAIENITSEICVPLFDEGEAVGFINVESRGGVKLTRKDLDLMVALGEHVSVALSRARLHARVRRSEERFRALTQNSSDLITLLDADGTIRYQSLAIERILGYSSDELLGKNGLDYVHPKDLRRVEKAFTEGLKDPERRPSVEYRFRHADGSWVWLESVGTNLLDDPGIGEYVLNSRDVTERKEAEERLREAEQRYRTVVEEQTELVCRFLPDLTLTFVNGAYSRYFGREPEELVGSSFLEHIPVEDRSIYEGESFLLSMERPTRTVEHRVFKADGEVRWQQWTDRAVFDEEGSPVEYQSVGRDVTDRKLAEQALLKSEAGLAEAQRLAHLGGWEWDMVLDKVSWSDEVYRIYGFAPQEIVPSLERLMEVIHPDDRGLILDAIDAALNDHKPYDLEHRIVRPDGEVRWVHRRAEVIRDEGGRPLRMVGTVHDLTDRKQAEARLKEAEARYRSLVEQVPVAIYRQEIEHNGTISYISPQIESLTGYTPEEYADPAFWVRTMHPEDRQRVLAEDELTDRTGEPFRVEFRKFTRAGEVIWLRDEAVLVRDASGEPLYWQGVVSDITERKALEERLEHQALHDSLTDLPNRLLFVDRLEHALRRTRRQPGRQVAVLFMDLDEFKVVNDSLGHEVGDQLLVAVAARLRGSLRPEDTLARFGGDEFVVLIEDVQSPEDPVRVAERILEALSEPFLLHGRELFVTVSVGVALGGTRWKRSEDLLRDADTAMYEAKAEAASGYRIFDPEMHERVLGRLDLENDLRRAIEAGEFVVHYQPILQLDDGRLRGVEALVRWEHPERGLLNPSEFIAVAEGSGLILPLGERVLREACLRAKEWQEEHPRIPPLMMSVNLSARQLSRWDLPETVEAVLKETGLEGRCLTLDVTETVYVKALEGNTMALRRLRSLGVKFSIDDFGTGYSSLSYLKMLPADAIKIDKSFTKGLGEDLEDTAIVRMVVELAHTLGMEVIAEGVENAEQARAAPRDGLRYGPGLPLREAAASRSSLEVPGGVIPRRDPRRSGDPWSKGTRVLATPQAPPLPWRQPRWP